VNALSISRTSIVSPFGGFPSFDLTGLLGTVLEPTIGCRICILTDIENPAESFTELCFMKKLGHTVQKNSVEVFFKGPANGTLQDFGMTAPAPRP